jgi:SWI/SNF-related matrix-associated actin-dependent regulator of chromatin subfamily A member 5
MPSGARQVCNHPYLFPGAEPEPFREGDHIWENSGKVGR